MIQSRLKLSNLNPHITILILLIVGIVSFSVGHYSAYKDLEFNKYKFEFSGQPPEVVFRDFQIYYDFTENSGKISFNIAGTNKLHDIEVALPEELSVTSILWTNCTKRRGAFTKQGAFQFKENQDFRIKEPKENETYHIITIIDKDTKAYWTHMEISLEGDIHPNAEFSFDPSGREISPPAGDENGAFFKFNLGRGIFICENIKCFESFRPNELADHYYNNTLRISTIRKESGEWGSLKHHLFTLNYNKKVYIWREYLKNLGLGIILIALGMLIDQLILRKRPV